jgi:hypothetical protein
MVENDLLTRDYARGRSTSRNGILTVVLGILLVGLLGAMVFFALRPSRPPAPAPAEQHLALTERQGRPFSPSQIPSWLFVHVCIIAALQVSAVIAAARMAARPRLARSDVTSIQFLVEIPMYLGLFGTLVGVCLTQFVTGSLVAPLAYLTTMCGILLHIAGKLFVLLPLPEQGVADGE